MCDFFSEMLNIENLLPSAVVNGFPHPILGQILKTSIEDILQDGSYPVQNSFPVDPAFFGGADESNSAANYLGFDTVLTSNEDDDLCAELGPATERSTDAPVVPLNSKHRWAGIRLMRKELEAAARLDMRPDDKDEEPTVEREVIEKRIIELEGIKESIEAKMDSLIYVAAPDMTEIYKDILTHTNQFGQLNCKIKQHQGQLADTCQHIRTYNTLLCLIRRRKRLRDVKDIFTKCSQLRTKMQSIEAVLEIQSGYAKYIHSAADLLDSLKTNEKDQPDRLIDLKCVQASLDFVQYKLQYVPEMILEAAIRTDRESAVPIFISVQNAKLLLECIYKSLKYKSETPPEVEQAMIDSLEQVFVNCLLRDLKWTFKTEVISQQDLLKERLPEQISLTAVLKAAANCLMDPTEVFVTVLDSLISVVGHYHQTLMVAKACANVVERGIGNLSAPFITFWPMLVERADKILTSLCNVLAEVVQQLPLPSIGTSISMNCRPLQMLGCGFAVLVGLINDFIRRVMADGKIKEKALLTLEMVTLKLRSVVETRCIKLFTIIREEAIMALSEDITAVEKWRPIPIKEVPIYQLNKSFSRPELKTPLCKYYAQVLTKTVPVQRLAHPSQPNNIMSTDSLSTAIIQSPFRQVRRWMLKASSVADLIMGSNEGDEMDLFQTDDEKNEDETTTARSGRAKALSSRPCIMEFELKILQTMISNCRGLTLMPFLTDQIFLSLEELWNLIVYSSVMFTLPQNEIQTIILPRETAAPEPNCVGGPTIENCYALCLEQRRVRILRQKMHDIIRVHCRDSMPQEEHTMSVFPRNVAGLCIERPSNTRAVTRSRTIMPPEARDSRVYYDILKRICVGEALEQTAEALIRIIRDGLDTHEKTYDECYIRGMQEVATDGKYLLNLSAAKSAYSLITNFGESFRLAFDTSPDLTELRDDPKLLLFIEKFRRSIEDELRRLAVIAGGLVEETAYKEFKERLLSVMEHDIVSVVGSLSKKNNAQPPDGGGGGGEGATGLNLKRFTARDLEALNSIFMSMWTLLRRSVKVEENEKLKDENHDMGALRYYLDAHKLPLVKIPQWYSDHIHYGIHVDAVRGLILHMAEKEADIATVSLTIQNWMGRLLRFAADNNNNPTDY